MSLHITTADAAIAAVLDRVKTETVKANTKPELDALCQRIGQAIGDQVVVQTEADGSLKVVRVLRG